MSSIDVVAWNNGNYNKSGSGYGIKISVADRDRLFNLVWKEIELDLMDYKQQVLVNIAKPSFWGPLCRELIHIDIGRWLIRNGLIPWPTGQPPKLTLKQIYENRFLLFNP